MTEHEPVPINDSAESTAKFTPRRIADEASGASADQRTLAMLAHLLGIVSGPVGAFVIYLVKKNDDFVGDASREALNFQLSLIIVYVIGAILTSILIGVWIIVAAQILNVVFCIVAASQAYDGIRYRYPLALRLISG